MESLERESVSCLDSFFVACKHPTGSAASFSLSHGRNCSVNKSISGTFFTSLTMKTSVFISFSKNQLLSIHLVLGVQFLERSIPSEIAVTSLLSLLFDVQFPAESLGQYLFLPGTGNNIGVQLHRQFSTHWCISPTYTKFRSLLWEGNRVATFPTLSPLLLVQKLKTLIGVSQLAFTFLIF